MDQWRGDVSSQEKRRHAQANARLLIQSQSGEEAEQPRHLGLHLKELNRHSPKFLRHKDVWQSSVVVRALLRWS